MKNKFYHIILSAVAVCCNLALYAQEQGGQMPVNLTIQSIGVATAKAVEPKVVAIETSCSSGATVFIENTYWQVNVKTSRHNKVRLETTVYPSEKSKITDAQVFSDMKVSLKGTENQVVVKSDYAARTIGVMAPVTYGTQGNTSGNTSGNTIIYFNQADGITSDIHGNPIAGSAAVARQSLTVYIPSGANVEIESKYGDVIIDNNIKQLKAYVNNGSLNMKDAAKAFVRTNYVNINAGDIKDAEFDISSGRMVAGNLENLKITSKSSDIELHSADNMTIHSNNDQYEIDQVATITGSKSYGSLRISNVKKVFDVWGANADIKIRHIEKDATAVKINNRYADVRLPVSNLENYSVEYEGQFSNIYAPFSTVATTSPYNSNSTKFKRIIGDSTGKTTGFVVKCSNCTIDFR